MTQARPIADPVTPEQQRFELELLLQQTVPTPEDLKKGAALLSSHPLGLEPRRWQSLQALPLAIDSSSVNLAVPSHWGDVERQTVHEQLNLDGRSIQWHSSLLNDLKLVWNTALDDESVEVSHLSEPAETSSDEATPTC